MGAEGLALKTENPCTSGEEVKKINLAIKKYVFLKCKRLLKYYSVHIT